MKKYNWICFWSIIFEDWHFVCCVSYEQGINWYNDEWYQIENQLAQFHTSPSLSLTQATTQSSSPLFSIMSSGNFKGVIKFPRWKKIKQSHQVYMYVTKIHESYWQQQMQILKIAFRTFATCSDGVFQMLLSVATDQMVLSKQKIQTSDYVAINLLLWYNVGYCCCCWWISSGSLRALFTFLRTFCAC